MKAADRTRFLGGTDAAAVLGVSSWATPVQLWRQKVGLAANDEVDEDRARIFARGKRLEPVIREMTIQKLRDEGHDVELLAKNRRYRHPIHRFLSTEIDFELRIDGEEVNADAKSVNAYARKKWGTEGTDEIPIEYTAQFMMGMDVAPGHRRRCLAAALRSFDDVDLYWVTRDDETIEAMRAKLVEFWTQHVVPRVPPDPVKFADVRALFPQAKPSSIEATPAILAKVDRLRQLAIDKKDLDSEEERLRFEIGHFMGEHALLTHGVRDLLTWETQLRETFDTKAFRRQHRTLAPLFTTTTETRVMRFAARR